MTEFTKLVVIKNILGFYEITTEDGTEVGTEVGTCEHLELARMFAAAPAMAESLRHVLYLCRAKWGNLDPDANEIMQRAESVLKLARGEASDVPPPPAKEATDADH